MKGSVIQLVPGGSTFVACFFMIEKRRTLQLADQTQPLTWYIYWCTTCFCHEIAYRVCSTTYRDVSTLMRLSPVGLSCPLGDAMMTIMLLIKKFKSILEIFQQHTVASIPMIISGNKVVQIPKQYGKFSEIIQQETNQTCV